MELFDAVLEAVFMCEHPLATKWNNPLECYFPIRFVNANGSFAPAYACTRELSGLKFVIRASVLHQLNMRVLHNVTADSTDNPQDPTASATGRMARDVRPYLQWVQGSQSTAFGVITQLSGLATAITKSSMKIPNTFWSSDDRVTVNGITVTIPHIRHAIARIINDATQILRQDIFMRLPLSLPNQPSDNIVDRLSNEEVNYSLWTDQQNSFYKERSALVDRVLMLNTPEPFHKGLVGDTDKQIIWDPVICKKWLEYVFRFLKLLSALYKMTAGQPPRDTETEQTLIANNPWRRRSLLAVPGHLLWILEYNKTRAFTRTEDFIVRVLPPQVAEITMLWVQYGVPLYGHIIRALYGLQPATMCHYMLFAGPKGAWKDGAFSEYFQIVTKNYLGVEIGTADWRQLAVAVRQKHIDSPRLAPVLNILGADDVAQHEEDIGARQTGHSVATEQRNYATLDQLMHGMSSEIFALFIE
ncbi:hypothetical protein K439DRAFT_1666004, partial [Ramaria rubella]